ncbi:universal stress protein [Halomonas sp. MCCC 1A17488]|uniref:Universal stress protein n=1 Tax=Billgrantia sulfidoxydans TaxID=2733484 RepID=A0ABX7W425_9GAMM|nr:MULTISPECIES: universal stress protein [Halomonas]MCE8015869.1 universal stress protein [Halomonas sp. MCCC 1A17488]MCG3239202.1 universal stress protein [Halomonas sp. MCCC 1A17488]QPP50862.1 universal stress protein [Halomonas sp. SS10-MC5]QTP54387.1 universal stress protein [Halomonas sulfidoxydans]
MYQSILVPVDGSEGAKKALDVACQLASQADTTLHILHIPEELSHETTLVWGIGAIAIEASRQEREEIGRQVVDKAAEAARAKGIQHIETVVGQGDPARTIVSEARRRGVEAIVMGSRGLSDLRGLVVGSVSHKVSHVAECTVITVR